MISLIKNELYKILLKKSTLLLLIISTSYFCLINYIYSITEKCTNQSLIINFYNEYTLLIIIIITIISGSIVSEEFSNGTIKNLLIKPFSRNKILISKYITSLIILILTILMFIIFQVIIGGYFLDIKSLFDSVNIVNIKTNDLESLSTSMYFIQQTLSIFPMFLIFLTISFAFGTLLNNSSIAVVVSIFAYIGSGIVNALAYNYQPKFLKYFPTTNWDLRTYLYGGNNIYPNTKVYFSIITILIYLIAIIIITFVIFNKKDIKNI